MQNLHRISVNFNINNNTSKIDLQRVLVVERKTHLGIDAITAHFYIKRCLIEFIDAMQVY